MENRGNAWTKKEEDELLYRLQLEESISSISKKHKRSERAIEMRVGMIFSRLLENGEKKSVLTKKYHMTENEISNYMEFMNDSKTNSQIKNDNIRDLISIVNEKLDRIEKKLLKIEEIDKYIYKKLKG
jgi:hypothetical protein